ncbi:MAG TPA: methylmalonyl-CoA mutase family protein, partial [Terriglobales bacterium]|nr:methylmalonyl-CoA mutase family protein [Terriglobales bacterium]
MADHVKTAPASAKSAQTEESIKTSSNIEVHPLYTPADLQGWNYDQQLGYPGQFPFTRGIHPTMYRGRLWTMR